MWPVNLVEKISRLKEYIKNLISEVNEFEQSLDKITVIAMRKSAVEDVDLAFQKVMLEVEEKGRILFPNEEIYIFSGCSNEHTTYYLSAEPSVKDTDEFLRGENIICLPVETFMKLINKLKNSITNGELDSQIHLTGNHLIYDRILEASTEKPECVPPLVAGVYVDAPKGELVEYVCPNCRALVLVPFISTRTLYCVSCGHNFRSDKTSLRRFQNQKETNY